MKKLILGMVVVASFLMTGVVQAAEQPFEDVPMTHPYYREIAYMKDQGIVRGYSDGNYEPGQKINRAEFMKIIVETMVGNEPFMGKEKCFDDVPTDAWYFSYVCYGRSQDFVNGYPDGTFKPGQDISFVEASKILAAAFDLGVVASDPWYKTYVEAIEGEDAIPPSVLAFDHKLTRGEMAAMIYALKTNKSLDNAQSYDDIGRWQRFKDKYMDVKFDESDLGLTNLRIEKGFIEVNFYNDKLQRSVTLAAVEPGFDPSTIDEMRSYTCGIDVVSLKEFCDEDCEKVGDHVATDYHTYFSGDAVFGGFAFSEWSTEYPSMCFNLSMTDALDAAAKKEGVSYIEAASGDYDVKKMIKDGELGDNLKDAMSWLEEFAKSIKRK